MLHLKVVEYFAYLLTLRNHSTECNILGSIAIAI